MIDALMRDKSKIRKTELYLDFCFDFFLGGEWGEGGGGRSRGWNVAKMQSA